MIVRVNETSHLRETEWMENGVGSVIHTDAVVLLCTLECKVCIRQRSTDLGDVH